MDVGSLSDSSENRVSQVELTFQLDESEFNLNQSTDDVSEDNLVTSHSNVTVVQKSDSDSEPIHRRIVDGTSDHADVNGSDMEAPRTLSPEMDGFADNLSQAILSDSVATFDAHAYIQDVQRKESRYVACLACLTKVCVILLYFGCYPELM